MTFHRLSLVHIDEGFAQWRLECLAVTVEDKEKGLCCTYERDPAFDNTGCACSCEACADGSHEECGEDNWDIPDVGWRCQCRPINSCAAKVYFDEIGAETIGTFQEQHLREYPIPVVIEWDGAGEYFLLQPPAPPDIED